MASLDFTDDIYPTSAISATRLLKLTNVVDKLQERFFSGQTDPITLDELIDEFGLIIDASDRHWLTSEALLSNEKIDVKKVSGINRFIYKPPLDLKTPVKIHLLNLIKFRHEKCEGVITVDDVRDSISKEKADSIINSLIKSGQVVKVKNNKQEVLLYTDRDYDLHVNTEFLESWRKISVEGLDNKKISDFLNDQGHYVLTKDTQHDKQIQ